MVGGRYSTPNSLPTRKSPTSALRKNLAALQSLHLSGVRIADFADLRVARGGNIRRRASSPQRLPIPKKAAGCHTALRSKQYSPTLYPNRKPEITLPPITSRNSASLAVARRAGHHHQRQRCSSRGWQARAAGALSQASSRASRSAGGAFAVSSSQASNAAEAALAAVEEMAQVVIAHAAADDRDALIAQAARAPCRA